MVTAALFSPLRRTACTAAILAAFLPAPAALAEPDLVSVEIIEGWQTDEGPTMVGLRIRVADGWKTYWRSPGDAGIPPRFDWSGSDNLAAVRIHWPRPEVFDQGGLRSIGYAGEVVLPVELFPRDPSQAVQARGDADLGVCREVCVPVRAAFGPGVADAPAIRTALSATPSRDIAEAACEVTPISDGLQVTATLDVPPMGADEMTVLEVADSAVWVSEAVMERNGHRVVARADLVPPEAAPFSLDRSQLRITVLGASGAAETMGCAAG